MAASKWERNKQRREERAKLAKAGKLVRSDNVERARSAAAALEAAGLGPSRGLLKKIEATMTLKGNVGAVWFTTDSVATEEKTVQREDEEFLKQLGVQDPEMIKLFSQLADKVMAQFGIPTGNKSAPRTAIAEIIIETEVLLDKMRDRDPKAYERYLQVIKVVEGQPANAFMEAARIVSVFKNGTGATLDPQYMLSELQRQYGTPFVNKFIAHVKGVKLDPQSTAIAPQVAQLRNEIIELQGRYNAVAQNLTNEMTGNAKVQEALKGYVEKFTQLQAMPLPHANVVAFNDETVTIQTGGRAIEVKRPTKDEKPVPFAIGDTVKVMADTMQIVEHAKNPPVAGEVLNVVRVVDDRTVEVDRQGSQRAVTYHKFEGKPLEEGDRVVLDASATVVIANLGKPADMNQVETATGVCWDDIGGLAEAKRKLREAIEAPVLHAAKMARYGKKPSKGALLYGPPGCVDGAAEVMIHRAGKGFKLPLGELVRRFNGGTFSVEMNGRRKKPWSHVERDGRCEDCGQKFPCSKMRRREAAPGTRAYTWDPSIPTMVRCLIGGEFRLRELVAAYPKGVKPVLKMTLADGKVLRLTGDHEVARPSGEWTRADGLRAGDEVTINGQLAPTSGVRHQHKGYWIRDGLKHHPRKAFGTAEHRLVAEARENGLSFEDWLGVVERGTFEPHHVFLTREQVVHHKNEDSTDNRPENLVIMSQAEHTRHHAIEGKGHRHIPIFLPKASKVLSVEPDGEAEVFDITVAEAHNFVANGVVVHNCGKTILGKAAATAMAELHAKTELRCADCGLLQTSENGSSECLKRGTSDGSMPTHYWVVENKPTPGGFFYVKGPALLDKFVGETEASIRKLFAQARAYKKKHGYPAIIFIDEAEAILGQRGGGAGHSERKGAGYLTSTIVPQFLSEMDGLEDSGAFVLLATNRPSSLDTAIVRDGRMDRRIKVTRPAREDARAILLKHLRGKPLAMPEHEAADLVVEHLYDARHVLYRVKRKTSVGKGSALTLGHIVSGAMLAGIVDRATSQVMQRELAFDEENIPFDTTDYRVGRDDLRQAVEQVFHESRDVGHDDEIQEFCEGWEDDVLSVTRDAAYSTQHHAPAGAS